jgi:hypothetical protein
MTLLADQSAENAPPVSPADARDIWPGEIPLSWARASREVPFANLGDAISALVVGAISGAAVRHADFDADIERLVGIGTIVQDQRNGVLHLWGSGFDGRATPQEQHPGSYRPPEGTVFRAHAVRGPRTAETLRAKGVPVPAVYGDPAWFLPKILPRALFPAPTFELGVITHISELAELRPDAGVNPAYLRYRLDGEGASDVRIINTLTEPTLPAIIAKIGEILSCRRILSSSFHGLVIPMTYGVPALTFGFPGEGLHRPDAADPDAMDHRFGDFFLGVGIRRPPVFQRSRLTPTPDWRRLMELIDREHVRPQWTGRALFDAFPGRKAVRFTDPVWPIPDGFQRDFVF